MAGQRERHGPEPLREDQPDHHIGQRTKEAATEALHGAAEQQHRHRGRESADQAAEREGAGRDQVVLARPESEGADRREHCRDDRRDDEDCRDPGEEVEAADFSDHRRHQRRADVDLDRGQRDAAREHHDLEAVVAGKEFTPARIVRCHFAFSAEEKMPAGRSREVAEIQPAC
jgi:hypothetical protein